MLSLITSKPSAEKTIDDLKRVFEKNNESITPFSIEAGQKVIAAYAHPDQSEKKYFDRVVDLMAAETWAPAERKFARKCLGVEPIEDLLDNRFPTPLQAAMGQNGSSLKRLAKQKIDAGLALQEPKMLTVSDHFLLGVAGYKKKFYGSAKILFDADLPAFKSLQRAIHVMPVTDPYNLTQLHSDIYSSQDPSVPSEEIGDVLEPLEPKEASVRLEQMVGLHSIKHAINAFVARAEGAALEEKLGRRKVSPPMMHAFFAGNPGVGKTEVAKLYGSLLRDAGLLQRGHVVVVSKADLVGRYIGHTGPQTRAAIKSALDGVLFVDEAHAFFESSSQGFAKEALTEFNSAMLNYKDRLAVVFATYEHERERMWTMEPGLKRRIPGQYVFPDYTDSELAEILIRKVNAFDLRIEAGVARSIAKKIGALRKDKNFGNAGAIDTAMDRAMSARYLRLNSSGEMAASTSRHRLPSNVLLLEDFD